MRQQSEPYSQHSASSVTKKRTFTEREVMTYVGLVAADGVLSLIWLSVIFQSTLNRVSWECRTRIDGDENDKCHSVAKLPYWICL